MKIFIETENRKTTLELPDDLDLYELMEEFRGLVVMLGFNCQSVTEYFDEDAVERHGWIFKYDARLRVGDITPEEILCRENLRREKSIKMATVKRAINAIGFKTCLKNAVS